MRDWIRLILAALSVVSFAMLTYMIFVCSLIPGPMTFGDQILISVVAMIGVISALIAFGLTRSR